MAFYVSAHATPRRNGSGGTENPILHLHQGCPGAGCDAPDFIAVNHLGEAYAVMRALRSGLRYDLGKGRYVRNRIHNFRLWGDVREEEFTRAEVAELPLTRSNPGHEDYAAWRAARIAAAPSRAVEESRHIPARLARALGIPGVDEWEDDFDRQQRRAADGTAERVNDTPTDMLTVSADNPKGEPVYVKRLPERHAVHPGKTVRDAFGHDGDWFTVPGDFPASLPDEFHAKRTTYAVYQSLSGVPGVLVWVVVRADGSEVPGGTSATSRRAAVREALVHVARQRAQAARRIVEERAPMRWLGVPAPVRCEETAAGLVVHVKCPCEDVSATGVTGFACVADAARERIDREPGTSWAPCPHSPGSFVSAAGVRYTITAPGRRGNGAACLYGIADDGRTGCVLLAGMRDHSL